MGHDIALLSDLYNDNLCSDYSILRTPMYYGELGLAADIMDTGMVFLSVRRALGKTRHTPSSVSFLLVLVFVTFDCPVANVLRLLGVNDFAHGALSISSVSLFHEAPLKAVSTFCLPLAVFGALVIVVSTRLPRLPDRCLNLSPLL